jgi:digalactosyldiacylglycerol synthase
MTGTSINPLLRAAYLAKERPAGKITLVVPWLESSDQEICYPANIRFSHPDEQRAYVKKWLQEDAKMPTAAEKLEILFYSARYHDEYHSIFPMGDITGLIPDSEADVCVLEEPEHLNWYRAPFTAKAWVDKFKHVVGIIHTNYLVYTRAHQGGLVKEPLLKYLNQGMGRAYCHKIIKLSAALQEFASEKEVVSNVHGVRTKYLDIGDSAPARGFSKGAYFVGKLAWAKGFVELYNLMGFVNDRTGSVFHMDIYGSGPHQDEIKEAARKGNYPTTFHKATDHALLTDYRVFVNPSLSEVLCTTIVEALAMGKWVVCPKHPSNEFFEQFPNCLTYRNPTEFAANVYWALNNDPKPLSPHLRHTLSWEAANDRLVAASTITREMQARSKVFTDKFIAWALETVGSGTHGDVVRSLAGAKGAAGQIEYVRQFGSSNPEVSRAGSSPGSGSETTEGEEKQRTEGSDL